MATAALCRFLESLQFDEGKGDRGIRVRADIIASRGPTIVELSKQSNSAAQERRILIKQSRTDVVWLA